VTIVQFIVMRRWGNSRRREMPVEPPMGIVCALSSVRLFCAYVPYTNYVLTIKYARVQVHSADSECRHQVVERQRGENPPAAQPIHTAAVSPSNDRLSQGIRRNAKIASNTRMSRNQGRPSPPTVTTQPPPLLFLSHLPSAPLLLFNEVRGYGKFWN